MTKAKQVKRCGARKTDEVYADTVHICYRKKGHTGKHQCGIFGLSCRRRWGKP